MAGGSAAVCAAVGSTRGVRARYFCRGRTTTGVNVGVSIVRGNKSAGQYIFVR